MAEFTEVMRQIRRLCRAHGDAECGITCPLSDNGLACSVAIDIPNDIEEMRLVEAERIVMEWAAAHPEPRYPTWKEWWRREFPNADNGISPCTFGLRERFECFGQECDECRNKPIPADIAEKLGVKPIGGVNDENA